MINLRPPKNEPNNTHNQPQNRNNNLGQDSFERKATSTMRTINIITIFYYYIDAYNLLNVPHVDCEKWIRPTYKVSVTILLQAGFVGVK